MSARGAVAPLASTETENRSIDVPVSDIKGVEDGHDRGRYCRPRNGTLDKCLRGGDQNEWKDSAGNLINFLRSKNTHVFHVVLPDQSLNAVTVTANEAANPKAYAIAVTMAGAASATAITTGTANGGNPPPTSSISLTVNVLMSSLLLITLTQHSPPSPRRLRG